MATTGDVAVVTGAASGIGAALARHLGRRGSRLVLADIDEGPLDILAAELGATPILTDVANAAEVERLAEAAPDARLVCLNAGITSTWPGPVWEAPPDEWQRVMGVNLGGVVNGLRSFVPRLLAAERPSTVLITGSLAGLLVWPGGGPYAASKHAVVTVAEQAALALQDTPVGITVLCPALVRTAMSPEGEDPMDVAHAALEAVDDDRFIVMPHEWCAGLHDRANITCSGDRPRMLSM